MEWGGLPPAQARSLEDIRASGELRVCIAPVVPAYAVPRDPQCRENCELFGPVVREVTAFAESLGGGLRLVFHRVDWDEQFHDDSGQTDRDGTYSPRLFSTGKCDLLPSHLTKNDWRLKKMEFAVLFTSRMMVLVSQDRREPIRSPTDLPGKTAAVENNTSFHTWLLEQNETTFARHPVVIRLMTLEEGWEAVRTGQVDFTLVDADIALWKASHSIRDLTVAFPVGPVDEIGWACSKEDRDLCRSAQSFFDRAKDDETSELNRIWREEYGVTLPQLKALIQATK